MCSLYAAIASRLSSRHFLRLTSASASVNARSSVAERLTPASRAAVSRSPRTLTFVARLGTEWLRRGTEPPYDFMRVIPRIAMRINYAQSRSIRGRSAHTLSLHRLIRACGSVKVLVVRVDTTLRPVLGAAQLYLRHL